VSRPAPVHPFGFASRIQVHLSEDCSNAALQFRSLLTQFPHTAPTTVLAHATAIEHAAFTAYAPETSDAYKSKMRSLFQNLKSKSNPGLRLRIFDSSITPDRFVRMSGEELKSKERREEDRQIQKENMDKAMVAQVEKSISSSLTCGKCGQKKVSYSQAQTRSADEPMTVSTCGYESGLRLGMEG